jgi:AcrR family transcriptional regulator
MDRRTRKSREAIFAAFVNLMTEKNFEAITINDIANRADLNRGTIYLHFTDKFDLLEQCIEVYLAQLVADCLANTAEQFPSKAALLQALEYLGEHAAFYRIMLVNQGVPVFRNRLMAVMQQSISQHVDMSSTKGVVNKEVIVQFMASAIVGVLEWWIANSKAYVAADIVEQLWLLLDCVQVMVTPLDGLNFSLKTVS